MSLTQAQIGRCGELLVQLELLKRGIESSAMTTDSGIDLVAYLRRGRRALTVQVKANLKPKPGGGKGRMNLDWWIPDDCEADLIALVDLESSNVWLFRMTELKSHAQQKSNGRFHFFMTVDPEAPPRRDKRLVHVYEFQRFLIGNVIPRMTEEGKS